MTEFVGSTVLVTGAGSGIGAASAAMFATRGADVIVADIDAEAAERVADQLNADGRSAVAAWVDVAEERSVEAMIDVIRQERGRLDAVHANAAVMTAFGDLLSTPVEAWERTFAINARGAFLTAKACLPLLIAGGGGALCFTASDTTVRTPFAYAAYVSSKHAVLGLARSVAVDYGPQGVRSNSVSPGVTDTPGLRRQYGVGGRDPEGPLREAASLSPLGRVATPDDIADVVTFLCSPRARFVTGAHVLVDGGMTVTYAAE